MLSGDSGDVDREMVAERRSLSEVEVSRSHDLQAFCAVVISCKSFAQQCFYGYTTVITQIFE